MSSRMSKNLQATSAPHTLDGCAKMSRSHLDIDECAGLFAKTTSEGVSPAGIGFRRLIATIPAKRQEKLSVKTDRARTWEASGLPTRTRYISALLSDALARLRRKWFAAFTLSVTLAALVAGTHPAIEQGTLKNDLTRAPLGAA